VTVIYSVVLSRAAHRDRSPPVDIACEHAYHAGRRAEGVVFSSRTIAIGVTPDIGGSITGFALEVICDG
jgi:hypothetical protein